MKRFFIIWDCLWLTAVCIGWISIPSCAFSDDESYSVHTVFVKVPVTVLRKQGIKSGILLEIDKKMESGGEIEVADLFPGIDNSTFTNILGATHVSTNTLPVITMKVGEKRKIDQQKSLSYAVTWRDNNPVELATVGVGPKCRFHLKDVDGSAIRLALSYEYVYKVVWRTFNVAGSSELVRQPFFPTVKDSLDLKLPLNRWCLLGMGLYENGPTKELSERLLAVRVISNGDGRATRSGAGGSAGSRLDNR